MIAAVAFGWLLTVVVIRFQDPSLGDWMSARADGYSAKTLLQDVVLIFGASGVVSPLWSLRWEVLFSLLLPLYVLLASRCRGWWWAKLVAVFAVIAAGSIFNISWLFFLPMFAVGAMLAAEWERIGSVMRRIEKTTTWLLLLAAALVLTTANWTLVGIGMPPALGHLTEWVSVVGVTVFILIGGFWEPARKALESRPVAWLGAISFALYLVHEPIIIAARLLTFPLAPWVGLVIAIPTALVAAWLFARFVEQPAHRLSKWIGRRVTSTTVPADARVVAR